MEPAKRTKDLVVEPLEEELLVYDKRAFRAHSLNRTAALLWQSCDGERSTEELARVVSEGLGSPVDPEGVRRGLDELYAAGLLEPAPSEAEPPRAERGRAVSRRELARRARQAGAAALIPAVISIAVPDAVAAASLLPLYSPCSKKGVNCASGCCCSGGSSVHENGYCVSAGMCASYGGRCI